MCGKTGERFGMSFFETTILNTYKDKGQAWLKALPKIVRDLSERYGLSELTPASNLSYNYVCLGLQEKQPIVLKIGCDETALAQEAAALKFFEGYGGVRVLDEERGVLLLERAIPGDSLKAYSLHNEEKIRISCQMMKQLHEATPSEAQRFPRMQEWLNILDQGWDMPSEYLHQARKLRNRLLEASSDQVLLHGDLHHDNILKHGKGWVVIDPKGVIGAPVHETWAFVQDIESDTAFISNFFSFPLQEVRDWYFVHLILAACWNLSDDGAPDIFLDRAKQAFFLTSLS